MSRTVLWYGDDFSGNSGAVTDKLRTGVLNGSYTWSSVRELTSPTIDTAIDIFVNGDKESSTEEDAEEDTEEEGDGE